MLEFYNYNIRKIFKYKNILILIDINLNSRE